MQGRIVLSKVEVKDPSSSRVYLAVNPFPVLGGSLALKDKDES